MPANWHGISGGLGRGAKGAATVFLRAGDRPTMEQAATLAGPFMAPRRTNAISVGMDA